MHKNNKKKVLFCQAAAVEERNKGRTQGGGVVESNFVYRSCFWKEGCTFVAGGGEKEFFIDKEFNHHSF